MKAILVMDMPSKCSECDFLAMNVRDNPICILCTESCVEQFRTKDEYKRINTDLSKKPKWCPLREVPDKLLKTGEQWVEGYNACIDKILKGSENNG